MDHLRVEVETTSEVTAAIVPAAALAEGCRRKAPCTELKRH